MTLNGKTVLVTGAGRGIGRAISLAHGEAGAHVVAAARNRKELDNTTNAIRAAGGSADALVLDVLNREAVEAAIAALDAERGSLDVLINNHGAFAAIGPIWEVDPDDWWTDVEVGVRGTFNTCRAAVPGMRERRRGHIINLIGGGTAAAMPMGSGYSTAKTGVMRFTECLAETVRDAGITVIAMAPGLVRTAMTEYQMSSEAGQKYLPGVSNRFEEGDDLPPEKAADLSVDIALGKFDALTGRAVSARDDLDTLAARMDEFVEADRRTLRLPGFGPTMKPTD